MSPKNQRILIWLLVIAFSLQACQPKNVPSNPTPQPTPTAFPQNNVPLPPVLISVEPSPDSIVALDSTFHFVFSAPMQTDAPAAAISGLPDGIWQWEDARTLTYRPADLLPADSVFTVTVSDNLHAENGQALTPQTLHFYTAAPLTVADYLPNEQSDEVGVNADIIVTFNQPVVPLGQNPADGPAAFVLTPAVAGQGHWLNTSTYLFHPQEPLTGGQTYQVTLNLGLRSAAGTPLAEDTVRQWKFTTAPPRLVTISPASDESLAPDAAFTLTFNQPMDTDSVTSHFSLRDDRNTAVHGVFEWDDSHTRLTFTPDELLARATTYTLTIDGSAQSASGTSLGDRTFIQYRTWPHLSLQSMDPGYHDMYGYSLFLTFSAPLDESQDTSQITLSPSNSSCGFSIYGQDIRITCDTLQPETGYTITIADTLRDKWGETLSHSIVQTLPIPQAQPFVELPDLPNALQIDPRQAALLVQYSGVDAFDLQRTALNTTDMLKAYTSFDAQISGPDSVHWQAPAHNDQQIHTASIPLSPDGGLETGFYALTLSTTPPREFVDWTQFTTTKTLLLFASYLNTTLKISPTNALVWAVDARSGAPVASAPVTLYYDSQVIATGITDENGIWETYPVIQNRMHSFFAVVGTPGDDNFGFASDDMRDDDLTPYAYLQPPAYHLYLYTDRPIYKPGQTIHYRGVLRQKFDGQYTLPPTGQSVTVTLRDNNGDVIESHTAASDHFGAFNGDFQLPDESAPGTYLIEIEDLGSTFVAVAHYVKPTFALTFPDAPTGMDWPHHQPVTLEARYYFDAPVNQLPIHWKIYETNSMQWHDDYFIGAMSSCYWCWTESEDWVTSQNTVTDPSGLVYIPLDDVEESPYLRKIHVVAQGEDQNGQPVSAEHSFLLYPSDTLIGIHQGFWIGQTGTPLHFDLHTWDNDFAPRGGVTLTATVAATRFDRNEADRSAPVSQQTLVSDDEGQASLGLTLDAPGVYRLAVEGEGSRSEIIFWVSSLSLPFASGADSSILALQADQDAYQPGDQAQIFIPNPFGEPMTALVTLERSTIRKYETITLPPGGTYYTLPISAEDAPNIFLGVTLSGKNYQTAQGYINLKVSPLARTLQVTLLDLPPQAGPGDTITLKLRVTNSAGQPVQGEFSLALADAAALALKDDPTPNIIQAYYAPADLGVLSGSSAMNLISRFHDSKYLPLPSTGGGWGGGFTAPTTVRQDFRDTAYWQPDIVTDANGEAEIVITLPDNLTTWHLTARGLTTDTLVGQAEYDLPVSKPLLIQPSAPRFFILRDHAAVSALVINNTDKDIDGIDVSLQALHFLLDDPSQLTQRVDVPAHGRVLVTWWGTVQEGDAVSLLFSAQGGGFSDQTFNESGGIPIYNYIRPQSFVTAGTLTQPGRRLEVISLPPNADTSAGNLQVEVTPSLAGILLDTLPGTPLPKNAGLLRLTYDWLMRLSISRTLQQAGYTETLPAVPTEQVLTRLAASQQNDGGWSWNDALPADARLTADILTALMLAREYGVTVDETLLTRAIQWLDTQIEPPTIDSDSDELDFLAQVAWIHVYTNHIKPDELNALYAARERLSPRGRAFLTLALAWTESYTSQTATLLNDLQSQALRSASGAYWAYSAASWRRDETILTSSFAVYVIASLDPASSLLPDAVRYLTVTRTAGRNWGDTYRDAWATLALTQAMQASGDLSASFDYNATLNGVLILQGSAGGPASWDGARNTLPLSNLDAQNPNALQIAHGEGPGTLYYRADLNVYQAVETVPPLTRGLSISRLYTDAACEENCPPIDSAQVSGRQIVRAQVTLTVPHDVHYIQIEDYIPAGAQIVDASLKNRQDLLPQEALWQAGWRWWLFTRPQIYADHIAWTASYLPAGTYTLTYTMIPAQSGEYRVLPARAWLIYFPDVEAASSGRIFTITP